MIIYICVEAYVYPLLAPFLLFLHHDLVHQCIASFIYLWCFELIFRFWKSSRVVLVTLKFLKKMHQFFLLAIVISYSVHQSYSLCVLSLVFPNFMWITLRVLVWHLFCYIWAQKKKLVLPWHLLLANVSVHDLLYLVVSSCIYVYQHHGILYSLFMTFVLFHWPKPRSCFVCLVFSTSFLCFQHFYHVLSSMRRPQGRGLELARKHIGTCISELECIHKSSEFLKSIACGACDDGTEDRTTASGCQPIGFDASLNCRLSAPTPPRTIKILSWKKVII